MMKKRLFVVIVGGYLALFLCGCSGKTDEPGVVEYMAGAEHIKAYERTKSKIQDIDKSLKERYE